MTLLRPRYAALAVVAYFGVIAYLAWDTARKTTAAWYDPTASQVVYQTSLIGGVLLLAGLFVVASIRPRLYAAPRRGRQDLRALFAGSSLQGASSSPDASDRSAKGPNEVDWQEFEQFLDSLPDARLPDEPGPIRIRETETTANAAPRSVPVAGQSSSAALTDRLTEIRSRRSIVVYPEGKDTARLLSGLVAEIRPLVSAARRVGLSSHEIRRIVGEPLAEHETDLAQRVRLVEHVKETLEAALVERVGEDIQDVLIGIQRVNDAADRARAAELLAAEAVTLMDTGNYPVAIDRLERARATVRARAGAAEALRTKATGRSSWIALAGPAVGAVAYVAVSSMLLPGYQGFLPAHFQLNTAAILVLSYGWAGLLLYALTSVYMTLRPARD